MTVTFSFEPWEHFRALRAISRHWAGWGWFYGISVSIPLLVLTCAVLLQASRPETAPFSSPLVWFPVLYPLAIWAMTAVLQLYKAFTHQRQSPMRQGEQQRTLDETGLQISGPTHSVQIGWSAMHKVVETREFFLFYGDPRCGYYLPKRVLGPDGETEARQLIATHAPPR